MKVLREQRHRKAATNELNWWPFCWNVAVNLQNFWNFPTSYYSLHHEVDASQEFPRSCLELLVWAPMCPPLYREKKGLTFPHPSNLPQVAFIIRPKLRTLRHRGFWETWFLASKRKQWGYWLDMMQHMLNIFHLCPQIQCPHLSTHPKPLEAPLSLTAGWTWLLELPKILGRKWGQGISCHGSSLISCDRLMCPCSGVTAPIRSPSLHSNFVWVTGKWSLPLHLQSKKGKDTVWFP